MGCGLSSLSKAEAATSEVQGRGGCREASSWKTRVGWGVKDEHKSERQSGGWREYFKQRNTTYKNTDMRKLSFRTITKLPPWSSCCATRWWQVCLLLWDGWSGKFINLQTLRMARTGRGHRMNLSQRDGEFTVTESRATHRNTTRFNLREISVHWECRAGEGCDRRASTGASESVRGPYTMTEAAQKARA